MIQVDSLEKTQQIAEKLAQVVTENDIILLNGDLGAGKTTFSQYFGKALGVKRTINSPTFNIIKSYKGRLSFHHMDCYRLEDSDEDLGFDEYFNDNGVTIIEWSEFIQEYLPKERLEINIKYIDADKRVFEIISKGEHYKQIKEVLNDDNITN
ncbi:tRNA (adenosine(37)-N6)-threonylcarbamoyltransferase complex ATPase subunit type 1 TsaE [Mammaliicoccus sciuri]|uniref:tRNA (adenosine(37)-N6)-threonylcarbamoyltransferase complex ATPase subunit type 1 TsaE n=1 Tax=Mammaliicoccus TaxID=2803850 RepID=UPI000E6A2835|nr:tRNA (adenosine(37)-N6)-threonylcarbamoyltransferase complex ATPase subunit type 1 TsaE [Mammaliicoccus sciuri]MCD8779335.1 tRNA (adenosine(37)-N6)-threonylcarbamoyltransferase complex ATPase subunit type 1 TsaE [Mammaliicoccus sciuri]MCD8782014.1 tRNA (adenosine(37)-N6)-threonylcarbamoyltransferase complex ATPase subunit type 1 TsaE [Mammaliicoccus sciuri]MEB6059296.1 tRNA (adenosine(37)-N6)-threonylcarbamoyltransferase complex ATPase subunit type 1 TsaE [Mammaliicoccus sciuri]RIN98369.1 tR